LFDYSFLRINIPQPCVAGARRGARFLALSAHPDVRGSSGPHARDYDFSLFLRDVVNHAEAAVPKPDAVQVGVPSQRDRTCQKWILRKLENGSDGSRSLNSRRAEAVNSTLQFVSILAEHAVQAIPAFLLQTLGTDDTVGVVIGDLRGICDGACLCLWRRAAKPILQRRHCRRYPSHKTSIPRTAFVEGLFSLDAANVLNV